MSKRIGTLAFLIALGVFATAWLSGAGQAGPASVCGDGNIEGNETCDDGVAQDPPVSGDGCSAQCLIELCGDGVLTPDTEECDDSNTVAADGCAADCTCEPEVCGDGIVGCTEECDDGNTVPGDGCENDCTDTPPPPTGPQDKEQQACINEVNKRAAGIAKTQNKESATCLKDKSTGKVADFDACLVADSKNKVGKAKDKAASGQAKKCNQANLPDFGFINDIAGVQQVSMDEPIGLAQDLFGDPGNGAIVDKTDKTGSKCQGEVVKNATKLYDTIWKELLKTKKQALKGSKSLTAVLSGSELATSLQGSLATSSKIQKASQNLSSKPVKKCEGGNPAALFPGGCTDAQLGPVLTCTTQRVACRACTNVNAVDGIAMDCDLIDNGAADASCT